MASPAPLSPAEIAGYARAAGLSGTAVVAATAIALAESGGNPAAVHHNTDKHRTTDVGLWQINTFWHPQYDAEKLKDPAYNARAMAAISNNGTSWSAWTTYGTTRYQAKLAEATTAAATSSAPGFLEHLGQTVGSVVDKVPNPLDPAGTASDALAGAAKAFTRPLLAITLTGVFVMGGLAIAAIGLAELSGTDTRQLANAAATQAGQAAIAAAL